MFTPLEKSGFVPLYFQIQSQLARKIRDGALSPGETLPGEEELSRLFGVSRMTSRQALQGLKTAGLAVRERGRGTFVAEPKVEKDIRNQLGFTAEMKALGKKATAEELIRKTIPANPQMTEKLAVTPGTGVFMLRRLRFADGKPLALEEAFLPLGRLPGIEEVDFRVDSLYETLRGRYGIRFGSIDEVIEARAATKEEASVLKVPMRSSLLAISRILLDDAGSPIEAGVSLYRGDLYRAVLHLSAES